MLLLVLFCFAFFSLASVMQTEGCTENDVAEEIGRCLKYVPERKGGGGRNSAGDKADTSGQKDKRNGQHRRRKSTK